MSNTTIVLLSFVLIFVLFILVLVLFRVSKKNEAVKFDELEKTRTLDDFLSQALNLRSEALQELIEDFISTHKLPYRQGQALSAEAKKKLEFVRNVALNPNATAKHISFLNRELAKRYGTYKTDIETYEKLGLEERKSRQKR